MNKIALITGGTRGIGKQIALTFAKEGYNIALNYRTENEDLKNTKKEIEANNVKCFAVQGDVVKSISVNKGVQNEVNAVYETSPALLIKKGEESNITYEINLNDSIQAPVDKGQILGTITYSMNGNVLLRTNLVAENSIEKSGFLNITKNIFSIWFNLSRN